MYLLTEAGRGGRASNLGFESLHGRGGIQFTLRTVCIAKINWEVLSTKYMSYAILWFSLADLYCI
jgi:hypothetical protein